MCPGWVSERAADNSDCYTQVRHSICDLPETDILKIKNLVDESDKKDVAGLKAIVEIAVRCISTNPMNAWKIVKAYASLAQIAEAPMTSSAQ
jgi:hypothetical protein